MQEPNNMPQPEQKPAEPAPTQQETELREELERERGKHKLLKAAAVVLLCLFVLVAGAAIYVYHRITSSLIPPSDTIPGLARPASSPYRAEGEPQPFAAPGVNTSTSMPASTLGLFSGSLQSGPAEALQRAATPENADKLAKAFSKYKERPIVKAFLADLAKDPEVAKAMADGQAGNPLAMVAMAQKSDAARRVMAKYAARPEFLKLMMEMASDPELKSVMPAMTGGMPSVQAPQAQPAKSGGDPVAPDEGDIKFDPSAISGTPQPGK